MDSKLDIQHDLKVWMIAIRDQMDQDNSKIRKELHELATSIKLMKDKVASLEASFYPLEKSYKTEQEKQKEKNIVTKAKKEVYEELGILPPQPTDSELELPIVPKNTQPKRDLTKNEWIELFFFVLERLLTIMSKPGGIVMIILIATFLGGPVLGHSITNMIEAIDDVDLQDPSDNPLIQDPSE